MDNEKILKIIESCHFNFLIGSGASRNYLETLSNIEVLLTELDKEYQFNTTNRNYINFLQALNILILKRKNKLLPKEVNIFTTNMDLFLDVNLDNLGLEFNDGFGGKFIQTFDTSNYQKSFYKNSAQYNVSSELPLFNLFKLHGSLTWDKSIDTEIRYNALCDPLDKLNKISFENGQLIQLTKENATSKTYLELKEEAQKLDLEDHNAINYQNFAKEYDRLVMINPTKEKFENTTLRLEYYEQMRMYSNILERENSVLFVSGFSFVDEHIREITRRALNSNPTLLVIVFNFDEIGKKVIEELFPKLKYKNLYTELTGYTFGKVATSVFGALAKQLETSFNSQPVESKEKVTTPETVLKKTEDGKPGNE
ncbi:SIR2 family protein [Sphingobacterium sp. SGR-19]|uniref:SIR2 family protein n=1 Tax=Sphingobacterium sp. SGR-19 TaxID=2710886 RepID=UPI0013EB1E69|nr:SIR2 family protein [Sphingobacterium sp. SGR-19]NGM65430.1 hypothetical protein [Sphingobacterium sp. SGR-19]